MSAPHRASTSGSSSDRGAAKPRSSVYAQKAAEFTLRQAARLGDSSVERGTVSTNARVMRCAAREVEEFRDAQRLVDPDVREANSRTHSSLGTRDGGYASRTRVVGSELGRVNRVPRSGICPVPPTSAHENRCIRRFSIECTFARDVAEDGHGVCDGLAHDCRAPPLDRCFHRRVRVRHHDIRVGFERTGASDVESLGSACRRSFPVRLRW